MIKTSPLWSVLHLNFNVKSTEKYVLFSRVILGVHNILTIPKININYTTGACPEICHHGSAKYKSIFLTLWCFSKNVPLPLRIF